MNSELLKFVKEKTEDLMKAPSCCPEARAAAQAWLNAAGTGKEAEETKKYIAELEEDITPIDGLIAFAESDAGVRHFGAEVAGKLASHARDIKSRGAKYCDCPACAAALAILDRKAEML